MKLQRIACFLLFLNVLVNMSYFVNSISEIDESVDDNSFDMLPNQNFEQNQNEGLKKPHVTESVTINNNTTINSTKSSNNNNNTIGNQTITMLTLLNTTMFSIFNNTKATEESSITGKIWITTKMPASKADNITSFSYVPSMFISEEIPMDETTKILIASGIVGVIIVFGLLIWLCSNFGLFTWINRQFSKLTKKRVKQYHFDDIDCDPTNVHFRPRNFKGKGPLTIQKQLKAPIASVNDERLPEDLKDINIVFIRKMCAVYEIGSEIENVIDELERPVKESPRTKWLRTYEAK
ncbi:hypothetical protein Mgra_00007523, partial [Meloidogyne graminicola]